jgi:hypothetical protein
MTEFGWAALAERYGNNIETVWPIFDFVGGDKITGRLCHPVHLRPCDYRFGRGKFLIGSCFDLDKNNRPVAIHHNQVDFAGLAGVVAREGFEAFSFEEFLALPLPPFAEQLDIRKKFASLKD